MKKFFLIISSGCLVMACNSEPADKSTEKTEPKVEAASNVSLPYKATYSSDMKMGDAANTKVVLDFFTGWEDGTMKGWKDLLADSVWINFPDGQHFWLSRDSVIAMGAQFRANYSAVKLELEGFIPVHLNDKNEDYVLVWEKDYNTDKKTNRTDSVGSHAFWQVKNGKITGWQEYSRKLVAEPVKK